jgi:ABC-2 type transport system permease protein
VTEALRYEWTRITTLRSTWWLTGLAGLLGLGVSLLISFAFDAEIGNNGGPSGEDLRELPKAVVSMGASVFVPYLLAFVAGMIGVFAWGHEYRHGMIRATLTAVPSRTSVWVAKFLVVGVWVAVLSAVTGLVALVLGALVLSGSGVDVVNGHSLAMLGRCVAYTLVLTWLVAAFTAVVRAQVLSLVLMFLWPFLVENIISGVIIGVPALRENIAGVLKFLPFGAGVRMIRDLDAGLVDTPLNAWQGFAVFGGLCAVLMAVSLVLFQRRDA